MLKQQGFTLIEILLVVVIMTVLSAMVAPSFFQATGASVDGEARYMQKMLRLAAEESQLTGKVIRCSVYQDHVKFERVDVEGVWRTIKDKVFHTMVPRAPVIVKEARLSGAVEIVHESRLQGEPAPMARFMFWPDGRVSAGRLILSIKGANESREIQLNPGPGGIHLAAHRP
ncbi:MAG: prepilin-type N-terminal cleavage/methylation domain-containing protein [Mariprofundaceae bacterium]|nr:prepilin-type N-terminal cleavage/methylation domain-containing protein [Mariprofundaceae bacterium]